MKNKIYIIGLFFYLLCSTTIYSQCVTGDCNNGEGTYLYTNAKYWGNWKDGKRNGYGVLTKDDGSSMYKGNWSNDKKNGFGVFYWSDGDRYEGNWLDDKQSGQATLYWKNGDRFVGQFIDGNITENGVTTRKAIQKLCISGDCYNGYGKFGYTNSVHEGYFKNGKRVGKGKTTQWNNATYEGEYLNDMINGKGKFIYADESIYDGDWVNGERTGKGIFIWGKGKWEGDSYEGDFINGFRTGYGKYIKKDGTIQEGKWLNNVFQEVELASTNIKASSQTSNNSTSTNSPATDRYGNKVSNNSTSVSKTTNATPPATTPSATKTTNTSKSSNVPVDSPWTLVGKTTSKLIKTGNGKYDLKYNSEFGSYIITKNLIRFKRVESNVDAHFLGNPMISTFIGAFAPKEELKKLEPQVPAIIEVCKSNDTDYEYVIVWANVKYGDFPYYNARGYIVERSVLEEITSIWFIP